MFSIVIYKNALNEIDELTAEHRQPFLTAIREMAADPLSGDVKPIKGIRRRRIGDYRIAFTISFENAEVIIPRSNKSRTNCQLEPRIHLGERLGIRASPYGSRDLDP